MNRDANRILRDCLNETLGQMRAILDELSTSMNTETERWIRRELYGSGIKILKALDETKSRPPAASELTGSDPDFTGTLSTEEYIRSIRND